MGPQMSSPWCRQHSSGRRLQQTPNRLATNITIRYSLRNTSCYMRHETYERGWNAPMDYLLCKFSRDALENLNSALVINPKI